MRLNDELKLTRESRQGNAGMAAAPGPRLLPAQSLTGDGGEREADYELTSGLRAGARCSAAHTWCWRASRMGPGASPGFRRASRDEARLQVSTDAAGQRLDKFLRRRLENLPLSHLYKLVRTKKVRVNGARARSRSFSSRGTRSPFTCCRPGSLRLRSPQRPSGKTSRCCTRTTTSSRWDKPSGLAIHAGSGITGERSSTRSGHTWRAGSSDGGGRVQAQPGTPPRSRDQRRGGGCENPPGHGPLTEMFTAGRPTRHTRARQGRFQRESGSIDCASPNTSRPTPRSSSGESTSVGAHHWKSSRRPEATLLEVTIETGARTRSGATWRRSPSGGGDAKYGDFPFNRIAQRQWGVRRMFLHSARLALAHPLTKKRLIFEESPSQSCGCLPAGRHPMENTGVLNGLQRRQAHLQLARMNHPGSDVWKQDSTDAQRTPSSLAGSTRGSSLSGPGQEKSCGVLIAIPLFHSRGLMALAALGVYIWLARGLPSIEWARHSGRPSVTTVWSATSSWWASSTTSAAWSFSYDRIPSA